MITRTDQRVHQLVWAVFWMQVSGWMALVAVLLAFTVIGAVLFGILAFAFWLTAIAYLLLALPRGSGIY